MGLRPFFYFFGALVFLYVLFTHSEAGWGMGILYLVPLFIMVKFFYRKLIRPVDPLFSSAFYTFAYFIHLLVSVIRYWVYEVFYKAGDAISYHDDALIIAKHFAENGLSFHPDFVFIGTGSVKYILAFLYSFLPNSFMASHFLFTTISFIGCIFFYRAYRFARPDDRPDFYRMIIFFLPSIIYWTGAIGKDSWVFGASGIAAYGFIRFVQLDFVRGLLWLSAGLAGVAVVRPHVAGFMGLAMFAGSMFHTKWHSSKVTVLWAMRFGLMLLIGLFAFKYSTSFLTSEGLTGFSTEGIKEFIAKLQTRYAVGGSAFIALPIFTVLGPAYAFVNVLLRPFIWQAHNPQAIAASIESMIWVIIIIRRLKYARIRIFSVFKDPYSAFAFFYSGIMIAALVVQTNAGLLVRQRVMFLPFFWLLFC